MHDDPMQPWLDAREASDFERMLLSLHLSGVLVGNSEHKSHTNIRGYFKTRDAQRASSRMAGIMTTRTKAQ